MNKIVKTSAVIISSLSLVGLANAAQLGPYAGIGLGYSQLNTPSINNSDMGTFATSTSNDRGGVGGRVFGGYNFNQYFGLEAAYATYASSKDKLSINIPGLMTGSGSIKWTESALSLVGKVYLPIQNSQFNLYALGGAAEVFSSVKGSANIQSIYGSFSSSDTTKTRALRPTYGLGASYDINQQLATQLEVSRIQGRGNLKTDDHAIANADLVTLNLAYKFG